MHFYDHTVFGFMFVSIISATKRERSGRERETSEMETSESNPNSDSILLQNIENQILNEFMPFFENAESRGTSTFVLVIVVCLYLPVT